MFKKLIKDKIIWPIYKYFKGIPKFVPPRCVVYADFVKGEYYPSQNFSISQGFTQIVPGKGLYVGPSFSPTFFKMMEKYTIEELEILTYLLIGGKN
jgi:hypothetical protein